MFIRESTPISCTSVPAQMFLCRACDHEGERSVVVPKTSSAKDNTWLGLAKYAWSGYVLECEKCGIIYRSRQVGPREELGASCIDMRLSTVELP